MNYLKQIVIKLPNTSKSFADSFLNYLTPTELVNSSSNYLPVTSFVFTDVTTPQATFHLSDDKEITIRITNTTGVNRKSPHQYTLISMEDYLKRISPFNLSYIDHTGFNLPYFNGIHPQILELRVKLKHACLYHTFPKHLEIANWDFILPGTIDEINNTQKIDYNLKRTPKFEIVSFEKSSTPLIQLDLQLEGKYEDWVNIFPEALLIPEIRCLWIYLQNDYRIDICFVLNEAHEGDWSFQFSNDRLI